MAALKSARILLPLLLLLASCEKPQQKNVNYDMGERVAIGPFTYVVVESSWRSELGEGFQIRSPQNRFLILSVSVTNTGSSEISVPMLSLEAPDGKLHQELADGTGVANWLGILRTISPAQTIQGRIVFDVPLSSFRLRVTDTGTDGYEKHAWVNIPMRIDAEQVQAPLPGGSTK